MNERATFNGPNLPATLPDLDKIEEGFNRCLELYAEAFQKIKVADDAIREARNAIEAVTPGAVTHSEHDAREISEFNKAVQLPDMTRYLSTARKLMNLRCWHYVVDRAGMRHLMDAQAKKELDAQLRYVPDRPEHEHEVITEEEAAKGPPPFTAETVRATLQKFAAEANTIWRRGIANAFSSLDRRFRSHDGFKIGSRVILTRLADDHGSIGRYGNTAETLQDIERTFHVLDGQDPRHAQSNLLYRIERDRQGGGYRARQSETTTEYFKVVIYKNGNAHLWFQRDDLVEKVNKELAAYYGETIGDARTREPDPLESRAVTHAKLFGFYPTPKGLVANILKDCLPFKEGTQRILEPSAGTGNIAYAIQSSSYEKGGWGGEPKRTVRCKRIVDAIEVQPELAQALKASGKLNKVTTADFLRMTPEAAYDGVIMNPPFDGERDIDHVTHALKFLKPDGFLLAIMSAGVEFRETRKAAAFRKLLEDRKGWIVDLPAGSFASVGTYVNTILVGIGGKEKPWTMRWSV